MTWGNPEFDDSFRRSYTSATNPSDGSITQLSILTVASSEVPGGLIVTTKLLSNADGNATMRTKFNGETLNDEFIASAVTSTMRVVPTSSTTASVSEVFQSALGSETLTQDFPWYSLNTITCEGLDTIAPSRLTLTSSVAVSIPSIAARRFVKLDPVEDAQGGVDFIWRLRSENTLRNINLNITDDRPLAVTSGMSIP